MQLSEGCPICQSEAGLFGGRLGGGGAYSFKFTSVTTIIFVIQCISVWFLVLFGSVFP